MAKLPVIQYPHPVLAAKAEPVTVFDDDLRRLAADMAETMYDAPGVGLAANQVGVLKRMVVIDVTEEKTGLTVFVNPEIIEKSDTLIDHEEGCLSLKGLYEHVKRPDHVRVRAQDLDGKTFELDCEGLLAICVQHETDHLDGIVFIDHLSMLKKQRAATKLRKLRREEKEREKERAHRMD
ncbi:peptide deformylase [Sutterella sp.]|uniref:peptide deformylase n=1 Tax=Sutterella sp. TaxID=1981025 RepID=UPI0026E0E66C|nr:peptide deformylase [Sutterella sp.]MDO5530390.1 peptide deformylase [Sutterella sp.]